MKSVNNYFNILEIVLKNIDNDISLSDIIKISGLKRLTATRMVTNLKKDGYLNQIKKKGKYSIGPRLIYLNGLINQKTNVAEIAHPFLIALSQTLNETVSLLSWDGKRVFFLEEIYTTHPLKIIADPGSTFPLYCTAAGKIFLSQMNDVELKEFLLKNKLHPLTPNTITNAGILKKHLIKVEEEGIAYDREEHYLGVRGVGAGIKNSGGKTLFCIAVLGPSVRLTDKKLAEIEPMVKQCAMEISEEIDIKSKDIKL